MLLESSPKDKIESRLPNFEDKVKKTNFVNNSHVSRTVAASDSIHDPLVDVKTTTKTITYTTALNDADVDRNKNSNQAVEDTNID